MKVTTWVEALRHGPRTICDPRRPASTWRRRSSGLQSNGRSAPKRLPSSTANSQEGGLRSPSPSNARLRTPVAERRPHAVGDACDALAPQQEREGLPERPKPQPGEDQAVLAPKRIRPVEHLEGSRGQGHPVLTPRLGPLFRNRPDRLLQVERRPPRRPRQIPAI